MRKPGRINKSEIMEFQKRYGLVMDGKVGNQTWGQVLQVEIDRNYWKQAYDDLKTSPVDKPMDWWGFVAGVVASAVAGIMGFWHWLAAFVH